EHYRLAIKKDAGQFAAHFGEFHNAFQQAGKLDELIQLVEQTDLKALSGNTRMEVLNLLQQLVQGEKTRDRGLALFHRCWRSFPEDHHARRSTLPGGALWGTPEIYASARGGATPRLDGGAVPPWAGLDAVLGFTQDGRAIGAATRLLDIATRQNRLDA